MSAPTLEDVAREAGVSLATASRALHNPLAAATETRDHVAETARQLGYRRLRASGAADIHGLAVRVAAAEGRVAVLERQLLALHQQVALLRASAKNVGAPVGRGAAKTSSPARPVVVAAERAAGAPPT